MLYWLLYMMKWLFFTEAQHHISRSPAIRSLRETIPCPASPWPSLLCTDLEWYPYLTPCSSSWSSCSCCWSSRWVSGEGRVGVFFNPPFPLFLQCIPPFTFSLNSLSYPSPSTLSIKASNLGSIPGKFLTKVVSLCFDFYTIPLTKKRCNTMVLVMALQTII